jgi:plasmid maintenance system antidote protein VapI
MAKAKRKPASKEIDPHDLEEIVRGFITDSGLTMRAIHELSGVAPAQLSRFIRGERTLTLKTASQLAEAFEFTIAKIPK